LLNFFSSLGEIRLFAPRSMGQKATACYKFGMKFLSFNLTADPSVDEKEMDK